MNALSHLIFGAAIIAWMYGLTLVSLRMLRRSGGTPSPTWTTCTSGGSSIGRCVFTQWLTSLQPRPPSWVGPALTVSILVVTPIVFPIALAVGATRRAPDDPSPPSDFVNDMVDLLRGDGARLLIALLPSS